VAKSVPAPATTDADEAPLRRRLGWFVLLYLGGLVTVAAGAYLLRWILHWVST
jgi:hypothetical protein